MRPNDELRDTLRRIDGRGYKAYRDILGRYDFGAYSLSVDHVQGDPFAAPSRLSVQISLRRANFPAELHSNKARAVAFRDFLARSFCAAIQRHAKQRRGTGHSGRIEIDCGGQEVLERTSIILKPNWIEARFTAGLPAAGRRVLGSEAEDMLFGELPRIVQSSLQYRESMAAAIRKHVESIEDQEYLRSLLGNSNLVSFVGNGSVLPRRSGVDDRPLLASAGAVVVPFKSPPELETEFACPNQGPIKGMGIPEGVTLIVGGGYHGKSTLLNAIERGVYNHIPGDGREFTVTVPSAVKVRAEDGRYVEKVDISPFIGTLPYDRKTDAFSTENASGSTSQAANIIEALEIGAKLLLIDEDTSATNFIIRDARMQALVEKSKEPITPFIDKVRQLVEEKDISTIMVMGGAGDYFDVADNVVMMDQYHLKAVTEKAKQIVLEIPSNRRLEGEDRFGPLRDRYPVASSFDPSRGRRDVKIDVKGLRTILFGTTPIDLAALEQLVDASQTRTIAQSILLFARGFAARGFTLREGLQRLEREVEQNGLDVLSHHKVGNLARARTAEIAAAINRLRTLRVSKIADPRFQAD